jgi:hypothetical protein
VIRARVRNGVRLGALGGQLLLASALLLGSLELHSGGEALRENAGSWRVQPQEPGCAGPGAVHVDRAAGPGERHCPSCLHRLQTQGVGLSTSPALPSLPALAGHAAAVDTFVHRGERLATAARGPPSTPS